MKSACVGVLSTIRLMLFDSKILRKILGPKRG